MCSNALNTIYTLNIAIHVQYIIVFLWWSWINSSHKLNRYVFKSFLKFFTLLASFKWLGRVFHNVAEEVSIRRLPIRIVLFLFGISDVVDADRRGRLGWYQCIRPDMYGGTILCNALYVVTSILYWHRLLIGNQCNECS